MRAGLVALLRGRPDVAMRWCMAWLGSLEQELVGQRGIDGCRGCSQWWCSMREMAWRGGGAVALSLGERAVLACDGKVEATLGGGELWRRWWWLRPCEATVVAGDGSWGAARWWSLLLRWRVVACTAAVGSCAVVAVEAELGCGELWRASAVGWQRSGRRWTAGAVVPLGMRPVVPLQR